MRPQPFRRTRRSSFLLTSLAVVLVAAFLSPLLQAAMTAIKTPEQITQAKSPIWPLDPATFDYQGSTYDVYQVPVDGVNASWPWWRRGGPKVNSSTRPTRKPASITWEGSWRTLDPVWQLAPQWTNFAEVWTLINYPEAACSTPSPSP